MPEDAGRDDLDALFEIDRLNYLPDYILRKDDLCTMAHGLELRAPFLDHRFAACIRGVAPALRFTTPPKLLLAPALAPIAGLNPFSRKKRGFNPPISGWLQGDLAPRLEGLGERLCALTGGQLSLPRVNHFVAAWCAQPMHLAEQVLQLLILDESLRQLVEMAMSA
jgi:asparagine synthase (glutamine-hydrolysing)